MDTKEKKPEKQTLNETGSGSGQKRHRKRKRHHFNSIRAQMEFYFSDSNLSKDRFLKQLIDKDPFVPLEVFLTFNKMKSLTTSIDEIAKSLSNSELLELDEAQHKVRRKTAPIFERNVDEKTLYVESIPPTADHDWVREIFERFGKVLYVSLPKYNKSRKIKEFGFVEFEQESSVSKAVNAFKEFNGVLSMQETDPNELKSIKAFIKEQKIEEKSKVIAAGKQIKRKLDTTEIVKSKNIKTEDENSTTATEDDDNDVSSVSSCTEEETTNDEIDKKENETSAPTKKKRRKRKKKSKTAAKERKDSELNADASYYELKVLPKRDWKRLRNKYLNLQREKVAELKRKAWKEKQQAQQQAKDNATEATDATTHPPPAKKSKQSERKLQRMNMNFYGAGEEEPQAKFNMRETQQNPAIERAPLFNYEPGIIVDVNFLEPCVNVKEFKADMRQYTTVKYVDIKEGAMNAQLRLESGQAADDFMRQISCAEYKCKILTGELEKEYWKKIERDREMKMNRQVKVPQKRGREKVKKIIAKQHIRFGDDDE